MSNSPTASATKKVVVSGTSASQKSTLDTSRVRKMGEDRSRAHIQDEDGDPEDDPSSVIRFVGPLQPRPGDAVSDEKKSFLDLSWSTNENQDTDSEEDKEEEEDEEEEEENGYGPNVVVESDKQDEFFEEVESLSREYSVKSHLDGLGYDKKIGRFFAMWSKYDRVTKQRVRDRLAPVCILCKKSANGGEEAMKKKRKLVPAMKFVIGRDSYVGRCLAGCAYEFIVHKKDATTFAAQLDKISARLENIMSQMVRLKYNAVFDYVESHRANNRARKELLPIYDQLKEESQVLRQMLEHAAKKRTEKEFQVRAMENEMNEAIRRIKHALHYRTKRHEADGSSSSSPQTSLEVAAQVEETVGRSSENPVMVDRMYRDVIDIVQKECMPRVSIMRDLKKEIRGSGRDLREEAIWEHADDKTAVEEIASSPRSKEEMISSKKE